MENVKLGGALRMVVWDEVGKVWGTDMTKMQR